MAPFRSRKSLVWALKLSFVGFTACGPSGSDGKVRPGNAVTPGKGGGGSGGGGVGDGGADSDARFTISFPDALPGGGGGGNGSGGIPKPEDRTDALEACGTTAFRAERLPPDVMIVLDRSGSMMRIPTADEPAMGLEGSRWKYTTDALRMVMQNTQSDIAWGMKMFPTCKPGAGEFECTPNACDTEGLVTQPNIDQGDALNSLMTANAPALDKGATPIAPAVDEAVMLLKGRNNPRKKYVLLATDGSPNCGIDPVDMVRKDTRGDVDGALAAVAASKAAGFEVFVLGIAIPNPSATTDAKLLAPHQTLNRLAEAGGRARAGETKYYPARSEADLDMALKEISAATVSCTIPLDKAPPADAQTRVDVNDQLVPESATEGWTYTDAGKQSITLKGSYCTMLKNGENKKTVVSFGCPGKPVPPPPVVL